jgi:trehalose 6-phosphate phosphatase
MTNQIQALGVRMKSGFEALAELTSSSVALFVDFDGTLVRIAERPDRVRIDDAILRNLTRLAGQLDGALAIVTGREVADVDGFLAPHVFAASGVHGYEYRWPNAPLTRLAANDAVMDEAAHVLGNLVTEHDGLLLERKASAVALHYRGRPDLEATCRAAVAELARAHEELSVMHGKMVIEVKSHDASKGVAIGTFLNGSPFAGRRPVFLGDDVTDEAAFAEVNARGGISIKVGPGETFADYRLEDTEAVGDWLARLADGFDRECSEGELAT